MSEPIRGDKSGIAPETAEAVMLANEIERYGLRNTIALRPIDIRELIVKALRAYGRSLPTAVPDREPDGYAVLLDDANVAGTPGGWSYEYVIDERNELKRAAESSKRKTIPRFRGEATIVSEHHNQEVRKHFEDLVKKYAGADFSNTNTEAGCIWNDAVNLAEGIVKERTAIPPTVPYPSNSSTTPKGE